MTYTDFINWLEAVPMYGKKDGFRNMEKLLARFGDPQDQIPVIHVAGTNGKGSCCAMLAQILRESGYSVGLFTSPHLVEYTERIQVDGKQIPKADFLQTGLEVKAAAEAIAAAGKAITITAEGLVVISTTAIEDGDVLTTLYRALM
jgi:dihydrofolate synthase/folylpolyglutamate synthase